MSEKNVPEAYGYLQDSAHHVESRASLGLYNFLMGSSILVLAWAALFAATTEASDSAAQAGKWWVLVAISFVGVWSGLLWALLGVRTWHYALEYARQLRTVWKKAGGTFAAHEAATKAIRRHWLHKHKPRGWKRRMRWVLGVSANHRVLFAVPLIFSILHMVMLSVVMCCVGGGPTLLRSCVLVGIGAAWLAFAAAAAVVTLQCWTVLKR